MHSIQEIQSSFKSKTIGQRNMFGLLILLWQLFLSGTGIALSLSEDVIVWLLG